MAIDLDKIREIHNSLQNQGSADGSFINNFFQVVEGTNTVRVLPPKEEGQDFYSMTKLHRVRDTEGRMKSFHCRRTQGESCPLCDLYFGLWKTGKTEDQDLARQIKARDRYYMNIVDRETTKVKILSVGVILFKKIVATIMDADYGDITDLEKGHDFKIIMYKEGQWPKYEQSAPRPKPSPAGSSAEIATWMDELHDLSSLVKLEDYEELKVIAESLAVQGTISSVSREEASPVSDDDYLTRLKTN